MNFKYSSSEYCATMVRYIRLLLSALLKHGEHGMFRVDSIFFNLLKSMSSYTNFTRLEFFL